MPFKNALFLLVIWPWCSEVPNATDDPQRAYREELWRVGEGADGQVRLALWCEARGLTAERSEHLARAIEADPDNAAARAMLGQVRDGDLWSRPGDVVDKVAADAALLESLAKYNGMRETTAATAKAQFELARWCESQGLKAEAIAHFTTATRIDPSFGAAWARLGFRKLRGRWMTPEQAKAELAEAQEQAKADRRWKPLLMEYRSWLRRPDKREKAEALLDEIRDPRAVPAIARAFMNGGADEHVWAARLLGQLDGAAATRHLAILAAFSASAEVRKDACEKLRLRDPREVMEPLMSMLRDGYRYFSVPGSGNGSAGALVVEGDGVRLERRYVASNGRAIAGGPQTPLQDIAAVEQENGRIAVWNTYALEALRDFTGQDLGADPDIWKAWWADRLGYSYSSRREAQLRRVVQVVPVRFSNSCFAAGTPVHTLSGPRPIEALEVGDRVLSQNAIDGEMSYQPVVAVYHNPPDRTLRLRVGEDTIVATPIHRFWKVGVGWTLARDLRPGDAIRSVGGVARVGSIVADQVQPVYNLEVARNASFFVSKAPLLVHDHSLVGPVTEPFDAVGPRTARQAIDDDASHAEGDAARDE